MTFLKLRAAVVCGFIALGTLPAIAQETVENGDDLAKIVEELLASAHANRMSEAFVHWNGEGEIPGNCAVCHSSLGMVDYVRGPMTTVGIIDHPVGLGTTVDCVACHNSASASLTAVPFPSGATVEDLGPSAVCTVCHQGRASTQSVVSAIAGREDDVIDGDLSFINVHYAPAAATLMGGVVQGGFEYRGKAYKGQFTHVPKLDTCVGCHQPHTLEVKLDNCTACHQGANRFEDIRISRNDFDGNGNTSEGISAPINAFHEKVLSTIQLYASNVLQAPIAYNANNYPYFFADTNGDGVASADEANFPNRYQNWTPRLLKAAYNYQLVQKDKGIYSHNPHYALQLLFDSIEDLSDKVDVDMSGLTRP
ncbi:polyheme membrane-associated cytochrome C [uncultured Sulfitobacter sp.]|uniref:polyheme membrane-associated cytochrome C n=1 Tax=uncultured Sulfitobacter sp. TaxID=191468 RepID=UPI002630AC0B|nr:polyheme membrane-associated cytochrome C [uncultured Sulfitobacter sp.]